MTRTRVAEAGLERGRTQPVTSPSGRLAERVGDHLAAAERLISQSHQAVERVTAWLQHTDRRVRPPRRSA